MECSVCNGIFIAGDNHMLQQLPVDVCLHFPSVLTRKYIARTDVIYMYTSKLKI